MFYFVVGFRNIIKNFRRSLFTMISIVIGMIACLLTQGFFHWNLDQLRESMIRGGIGHYQLYARGFSQSGMDNPYDYLIRDAAPILKELRAIPGVELVTARMAFSGILSAGDKSTVVTGEAGNSENETRLNAYAGLIRGARLSSETPYGIVVGDGVARKLSVTTGDTVTLLGTMRGGVINAVDLETVGITRSGVPELDNVAASTSLEVVQNLLDIGGSVQKIVVLLKNTGDTPKILPRIERIAHKYRLEHRDWETLAEFYRSLKVMYDVVFYIVILIVLAIVTFTISNTVNMNLNDRVREIGTLRALGTRRIQVAWIFIAESGLIGMIGGIIGVIASYLFIGVTVVIGGLPVLLKGAEQSRWVRVYFHPDGIWIALCIALFVLVAMIASAIPARRASRISITEALRWI